MKTYKEYMEETDVSKQKVTTENKLKEMIVEYVGERLKPENGEVTVEMIVDAFSSDFPEPFLVVAEENYMRGWLDRVSYEELSNQDTDELEEELK